MFWHNIKTFRLSNIQINIFSTFSKLSIILFVINGSTRNGESQFMRKLLSIIVFCRRSWLMIQSKIAYCIHIKLSDTILNSNRLPIGNLNIGSYGRKIKSQQQHMVKLKSSYKESFSVILIISEFTEGFAYYSRNVFLKNSSLVRRI